MVDHALEAVDPYLNVCNNLSLKGDVLKVYHDTYNLGHYSKIHVLGAGKAVGYLMKALQEILPGRFSGGVLVSSQPMDNLPNGVTALRGNHPVPGQSSYDAGKAIHDYAVNIVGKRDLVFFLLTGGASSLMVYPREPYTLYDIILTNQKLLASGSNIREINRVRKQLSLLKGGGLASLLGPATVVTLAVSDVIGSPPEVIGSGPTAPSGDYSQLSHYYIIADNQMALQALKDKSAESGLNTHILNDADSGEAKEYAKEIAQIMKKDYPSPALFLSGGELTVTLGDHPGKGGRNQEFILSLMMEMKDFSGNFFALSLGTDGIDGFTDAAGAWISEASYKRAKEMNINLNHSLKIHDSYNVFRQLNHLIKIGPTRTNVMDLRLFFLSGQEKV